MARSGAVREWRGGELTLDESVALTQFVVVCCAVVCVRCVFYSFRSTCLLLIMYVLMVLYRTRGCVRSGDRTSTITNKKQGGALYLNTRERMKALVDDFGLNAFN